MHIVDEPIETIHLYVVREEEKDGPLLLPLFAACLCLAVIASVVAYSALHPAYEHETLNIPAQFLPLQTFTATQTIIPTGIKTYPATTAQGTLTLTNGSVETIQLPQGMIFTGKDGTEVITDSATYVPAGSAEGFGMATVSAHLLTPGMNMSSGDIDQVLGTALYVRNLSPFLGGKPAYSVKVITSQDKQRALEAAKVSLTLQQARIHAILAAPCREAVSWSTSVHLERTCQFVANPYEPGVQITAIRLRGKSLLIDIIFIAPPKRIWGK